MEKFIEKFFDVCDKIAEFIDKIFRRF